MATKAGKPTTQKTTVSTNVDFSDYQGMGFENQTSDDVLIPFLNVLQSNSPEVDDVTGAKPGMLYNTASGKLYTELVFVPCLTQHSFVEWRPRDAGGGFVNRHGIHDPIVLEAKANAERFGKNKTPNGNDLVETFYIYGIYEEGQEFEPFILSCSSTKISAYKAINYKWRKFKLNGAKVPLFANLTKISTVKDENQYGKFFNINLSPARGDDLESSFITPDTPIFKAGMELYKMVESGRAKPGEQGQEFADDAGPF